MNRALPDITRALETLQSAGTTIPSPLKQRSSNKNGNKGNAKNSLGVKNAKPAPPIHERFAAPVDTYNAAPKTWSLQHKFIDRPALPQPTLTEKQKRAVLRHKDSFLEAMEESERLEDEKAAQEEELRKFKYDISEATAKMTETIRAIDEITVQGIQEGRYISDDEGDGDDGTTSRSSINTVNTSTSRTTTSGRMKKSTGANSNSSLPTLSGKHNDALRAVKEFEEFDGDEEVDKDDSTFIDQKEKKSNFKEYMEDQLLRAGSALPIEYYSRQLKHRQVHKEIAAISDRIENSTRNLRKTMIDLGIEEREKREKEKEADRDRARIMVDQRLSKEIQSIYEEKGIRPEASSLITPEERAAEEHRILQELKAKRKKEAAAALEAVDEYDSDDMADLNQELQRIGEVFKSEAIDDCRLPEPIQEKLHWLRKRTFAQMKNAIKMEKSILRDELKEMHTTVHERERTLLQYKDQLDEIENVFKEQANNEKLVKDVIENKFKATLTQLNDHLLKQNQKVLEISESIGSSQKYRFKIMSMLEELSKKRLRCDPFVRRRAVNLVKGLLKNLDDAALAAQEERENRLREQYRLMLEIQQKIQDEEETIGKIQERNRDIDKEIKATSDRIAREKIEFKEKAQILKAKDEQTSAKLQSLESIMSEYAREERRKVHIDSKSKRLTKRSRNSTKDGVEGDETKPLSDANFVKHLQDKYAAKERSATKKLTDDIGSSNSSAEEEGSEDEEDDEEDDEGNGSDGSSGSDAEGFLKTLSSGEPNAIPPMRKPLDIDGIGGKNISADSLQALRNDALGGRPPLLDSDLENSLDISVNEGARKNMIDQKITPVAILKPETTISANGNVMVLPGSYDPISSTRAKRQTILGSAGTSTPPPAGQFTPLVIEEGENSDEDDENRSNGSKARSSSSSLTGSRKSLMQKSMGIGGFNPAAAAGAAVVEPNIDPTSLYHPVVSSVCTACYAHYYQEYLMKHPAMNFQRNSPRANMAVSSQTIAQRKNSTFGGRNHPNVNPMIDCLNQSTFQFTIEESSKVLLECLERIVTRKETTASAHIGGSGLKGGSIISESVGEEMKQEINAIVKLSLIHQVELPSQQQKSKSRDSNTKPKKGNNNGANTDTPKLYPNEYLELLFKFHEHCKSILQTIAKNGPKLLLVNNTRTMFGKVLQDILAVIGVVSNVTLYFWDPAVIATRLNINPPGSANGLEGRGRFNRGVFPVNSSQASVNFALLYVKSTGWMDVFGRQVIDAILHYGQADHSVANGQKLSKQQEIRRMSRLLATMKDKNGQSGIKFDDEGDLNDHDMHPYADPDLLFNSLFKLIEQYFVPDNFQTFHKEKATEIQSLVSFFMSECKFMIHDGLDEATSAKKKSKFMEIEEEDQYRAKTFEISHRNALQCMESFLLTVFHVNDAVIKKTMKKQNHGAPFFGPNSNTANTGNSNLQILLNMMTFYIERAKHDGENIGKVKSGYVVEKPLISLENIDDLMIQLAYPQIIPPLIAINLLRRVVEEDISKRIFLQKIVLGRPEVADLQYLNVAMSETEEQMFMALTRQRSGDGKSVEEEVTEKKDDATEEAKSSSTKSKGFVAVPPSEVSSAEATSVVVRKKSPVPAAPPEKSPKNRPGAGLVASTPGKVATPKDSFAFSGRKTVLVEAKEFSLPMSMVDEKGNVNVRPHPPKLGSPKSAKLKPNSFGAEDIKRSLSIEEKEKEKEIVVSSNEIPRTSTSPKSAGSAIRKMITLSTSNSDEAMMIVKQINRAEEILKKFKEESETTVSDGDVKESNEMSSENAVPSSNDDRRSSFSMILPKPIVLKKFETTRDVHDQWLNDLEVYIHHLCKQISTVIWSGTGAVNGNVPTETTIISAMNGKNQSRFKKKAAIPLPDPLIFRILNYIDALRKLILSRNVNSQEILLGIDMIKSIDGKVAPSTEHGKPSEMLKEFQSIIGEIRRCQHRVLHIINAMTMPLRRRLHWLQKKYDEFIEEHFSLLTNIENMKKKFDQTKNDIEDYRKSIGIIQQEKTQKMLTSRLKNSVNALRTTGNTNGPVVGHMVDDTLAEGISGNTATPSSPTKIILGSRGGSISAGAGQPKGRLKKGSVASIGSNSSVPGQQVQTITLVPHSFEIQKLILEHASNEYLTKLNSLRQKEAMLIMALKHFQSDYETLSNHSRGLALAHQDMLTSLPPSANRKEVQSVLSGLSFDSEELLNLHLNGIDRDSEDSEDEEGDRLKGSLDAIDQKMRKHQATLNRTTLMLDAYTRDSIAARFSNSFGAKTGKGGVNGMPGDGPMSLKHPRLSEILPQYLVQSLASGKPGAVDAPQKLSGKEWIEVYLKAMGGDTFLHGHGLLPISPPKNPYHQGYFNPDDPNQPSYMKMTAKLEKSIKQARLKWYQQHYDKDGNYIYPDGSHGSYSVEAAKGIPKQVVKPKVFGFARTIMSGLVDMEKLTEEQRFHELVKEQLQENSSNQDSDPHKKKEEMMARSFLFYLGGNIFNPSATFNSAGDSMQIQELNGEDENSHSRTLLRPHSTGALDRRKSFSKEFQPFLTLEGREMKPISFDSANSQNGVKKRFYLERLNRTTPFKYADVFNSDNFRIFTPLNLRKLLDVQELILKNNIKTFNDLHVRDEQVEATSKEEKALQESAGTEGTTSVVDGKKLPGNKLSVNFASDSKKEKTAEKGKKDGVEDLGMSIQGVSMQVPDPPQPSSQSLHHGRSSSIRHSLAGSHDPNHHHHFSKKQMKAMLHQARLAVGHSSEHPVIEEDSEEVSDRHTVMGRGFPQVLMSLPGQIGSRSSHIADGHRHGRSTWSGQGPLHHGDSHRSINIESANQDVSSNSESLSLSDSISSSAPFFNQKDIGTNKKITVGPLLENRAIDNANFAQPLPVPTQDLLEDATNHAELRQFEFTLDKDIQKMIRQMRVERKRQLKAMKKKQDMSITQSALHNLAKARASTSDSNNHQPRVSTAASRENNNVVAISRNLDIEYEEWQVKILQWLSNTAQDNAKYEIDERGGLNHDFDDRPVEIGVGLHHHGSIFNALEFEREKKPVSQWKDIHAFTDQPPAAFRDIDQLFKREVSSLGDNEGKGFFSEELSDEFFVKRFGTINAKQLPQHINRATMVVSSSQPSPHNAGNTDFVDESNPSTQEANATNENNTLNETKKADDFTLSSMGTYEELKHKKRVRITEIHNKNYDQQYNRSHLTKPQTLESFVDEEDEEDFDEDDDGEDGEHEERLNFSPTLAPSNTSSRAQSRSSRMISTADSFEPPSTASRPGSVTSGILNETQLASMLSHRYHVGSNPFADIPSAHKPPSDPKSSASFTSPRKSKIIRM